MSIENVLKTSDFQGFLPPEQSAPIFNNAARLSAFQRLFRRIPLGINGQAIPVVANKPTAKWTNEGEKKHVTEAKLNMLTITPKKLTAIHVVSQEVARANPGGIMELTKQMLAEAFAVAFDLAVGFNKNGDGTGTGPFSEFALTKATKAVKLGTTTAEKGGIHGDLVAAMKLLVNNGKKLTGWALGNEIEPELWGATDKNGRPLYAELPLDAEASQLAQNGLTPARSALLMNRPAWMGDGVSGDGVNGFAGDFTKGAWGTVGGINFKLTTDAAVTIGGKLVSCYEENLLAVKAEAEYGYVNADLDSFVKLQVQGA